MGNFNLLSFTIRTLLPTQSPPRARGQGCRAGFLPVLVFAFVLISGQTVTATSASAQTTSCPWCVTPTTCSVVGERTSIDFCYVHKDTGQCHEGHDPQRASACEIDNVATSLITDAGFRILSTLAFAQPGKPLRLYEVADKLFVRWSCDGVVIEAVERRNDGGWIVHEAESFQSYRLHVLRQESNLPPAYSSDVPVL
jgi:hypothetical protein